jgi:hypothetical protein
MHLLSENTIQGETNATSYTRCTYSTQLELELTHSLTHSTLFTSHSHRHPHTHTHTAYRREPRSPKFAGNSVIEFCERSSFTRVCSSTNLVGTLHSSCALKYRLVALSGGMAELTVHATSEDAEDREDDEMNVEAHSDADGGGNDEGDVDEALVDVEGEGGGESMPWMASSAPSGEQANGWEVRRVSRPLSRSLSAEERNESELSPSM